MPADPLRQRDLNRVAPFIDAVVAVALTALVLPLTDIHLPANETWGDFLSEYGSQIGAFLTGFLVIAVYWNVHHKIWGAVTQIDVGVVWANLLWLLGIVMIPFATVLVNESEGITAVGIQIYALVLTVTSVGLGLVIYLVSNRPGYNDGRLSHTPLWWAMRWSYYWIAVFLASFFSVAVGLYMLSFSGIIMVILARLRLRSDKGADVAAKQ